MMHLLRSLDDVVFEADRLTDDKEIANNRQSQK